jgi:hypothetical protein
MTSDERKARRAEHANEAREYEVKRALAVLAKHGHDVGGGDAAELRAEHEALVAAHAELQEELAAAHLVVDKDYQVERIGELTQGLRDRDHFDRFRELATAAKMQPAAIKHLWRTSGFEASQDEVDERGLANLVARLKTEAPYAWPSEPTPAPAATVDTPARPAATVASGNGAFVFDRGSWKPS